MEQSFDIVVFFVRLFCFFVFVCLFILKRLQKVITKIEYINYLVICFWSAK